MQTSNLVSFPPEWVRISYSFLSRFRVGQVDEYLPPTSLEHKTLLNVIETRSERRKLTGIRRGDAWTSLDFGRLCIAYPFCMRANSPDPNSFSIWKALQKGVRTRESNGFIVSLSFFALIFVFHSRVGSRKLEDFSVNRAKLCANKQKIFTQKWFFYATFSLIARNFL